MFKFRLGQHCALALLGAAAAHVFGFECIGHGLVTDQAIVEREFFTAPHLAPRLDEDATIHFNRLTVWAARMVDPTRGIAAVQTINHPRVVDVKVKRVLRVARVMRVATLRLGHGDDFTHVFDDALTRSHVAQGEHAFAVDARGLDFDFQCTHIWLLRTRRWVSRLALCSC